MSVLRELITEFAIFSTPPSEADDEQLTTGDDTGTDPDSQGEIDFSVDNKDGEDFGDDHPEHDSETCTCPCHDKEGSLDDDENIEVIEPDEEEEGSDDDSEEGFSLDDEEDDDEDSATKYKFF